MFENLRDSLSNFNTGDTPVRPLKMSKKGVMGKSVPQF